MSTLQEQHETPNTTIIRRAQLLLLLQAFVREQVVVGVPPKGLEQAFAEHLQISPSLLSQIKKSRPIGDKLARQIESACAKSPGWLDRADICQVLPTEAEEVFIDLARKAWRKANSREKRDLMRSMRALVVK